MAAGAQVTDHDFGDEWNPLLVRPFMLQDGETPSADPSAQTWPSATTRVVRSTHSVDGAERTQIIPRLPSPRRRGGRHYRRRLLVIGGVGTAVIVAATAAGFAALRPEMGSPVSAGPDDSSSLPAVTGPTPAGAPGPAGATPGPTPDGKHRAHPSPSPSAKTSSAKPPNPGRSAGSSTAAAPGSNRRNSRVVSAARTGTISGQNGLCLDLAGGMAIDSNQIQVFTCNGSPAQTWTLATDGTLQVDGKCALVVGDSSVHITTCDERATAHWRADGSTLINAADNRCLTDPSDGGLSGTAVVVSTCTGSAGQRWILP